MICAILLAAGRSRRMGTQKLLLPFGGRTVIAHVAAQITGSAVAHVYAVVGRERERLARELSDCRICIVPNPDPDASMLESVRCGLRAMPQECEGVMVALGDQPGVTSDLIDQTVEAFTTTDRGIVVPSYDGKRGHPMLFSARYRHEVLTQHDEVGLRGLLWAHPEDVYELDVSTPAVLLDMDYPQDYRRELARLEQRATGGQQ